MAAILAAFAVAIGWPGALSGQTFGGSGNKPVIGNQTTALGVTYYGNAAPNVTPSASNWRTVVRFHVDTSAQVQWAFLGSTWKAQGVIRRVTPPPATATNGSATLDYRYAQWQADGDSTRYTYDFQDGCWSPLGVYRHDTIPTNVAAGVGTGAICYEFSPWLNTDNDSLYLYQDGTWLSVGTGSGGGGGSGTVTSVATGYGLAGGPITTTGTIRADTAKLATVYALADSMGIARDSFAAIRADFPSVSGVTDGDYGDIDVTGSGTVWTIDTSAVTWPKLAQAVKDSIQVGGSGLPFVFQYDNFRLPATHEFLFAQGLAANESVTNYGFASVDNTKYKFSTTGLGASTTEYGGWLANGTSGDSIAISAPCGVVIGDSQAEGHPARHGRLHPNGASTFSVNYQDTLGTISYTLRQLTKMRWFNHGIGGQTSDQVWARWPRDVLAQTFNPSDGRGSKTLQRKPNTVVIIVGINDFFVHTRSWTVTAQNLENMAQSARDNGIQAVFLNCPGDESANMVQIRKVDSLNTWMASGALQAFGAAVVDYNSWWRDPAYNDNGHGQSLIVDVIHPSAIGYDSLANVIFRAAKLPVLNKIRFTNELSPLGFSGYSRPAGITIQGVAHTLASAQDLILFSTPLAWDSVWVKINSSTNVTGTTYSGFSHIEWLYSNDTSNVLTKRSELYQAYQGKGSTLFSRSGTLISPTTTGDRLSIGTTTASAATTMFTVRGTTTDATVHTRMESSASANPIVFTNNGRIGINRTGASYNLHVSGTAGFEASGSDYWFFNGSASEVFGANPRFRFQSTSRNTGSTGRTDMDMIWTGNVFSVAPVSTAAGADFRYSFINKAATYYFTVDLTNQRIGTVNSPAYAVDFSSGRDGMAIPSGATAQRGATGGIYGLRMNTDSTQVEITPGASTWHYIPRSAYPVKTSGVAGYGAGGLLTNITIGTGLTLTGSTLTSAPAAGAGGIYGGNGNIANNTAATLVANGFFRFVGANGTEVISMKDGTTAGLGSVALYSTRLAYVYGGDSTALWGARVQVKNPTTSLAGLLELHEARDNGTNSAKIQAPANLAADYTLTTPPDDGEANGKLMTDGSGVLSWQTPSRAEISATATRHYTLTAASTNYTIDTLSSAFLTDFTYSAGVLTYTGTPTKRFLISYSLSIATDDSVLLSAGIDKNGAGPLTSTRQASSIGTNAGHVATANITGTGIVGLSTSDTLKIVIQSDGSGAPVASVRFASLTVTPID